MAEGQLEAVFDRITARVGQARLLRPLDRVLDKDALGSRGTDAPRVGLHTTMDVSVSSLARLITGQVPCVDGGYHIID